MRFFKLFLALCFGLCGVLTVVRAQAPKQRINAGDFLSKLQDQATKFPKIILNDYIVEGDLNLTTLNPDPQGEVRITVPVDLSGIDFSGSVLARGVHFESDVNCLSCTFAGNANFRGSSFARSVHFDGNTFGGDVDFGSVAFRGDLSFDGSSFTGDKSAILFDRTTFAGEVNFSDTNYSGRVDLTSSFFARSASFRANTFRQDVFFTNVHFAEDADFSHAQFVGKAIFIGARFDKNTSFHVATFEDSVSFWETKANLIDFTKVSAPDQAVKFTDIAYQRLDARDFNLAILSQSADYAEVLRRLEENFRGQNQIDLANEAYFRRRVVERDSYTSAPQRIGETLLMDWLLGYFVHPTNTLVTSTVLIVVFAAVYFFIVLIKRGDFVATTYRNAEGRERKFGFRLSDIPLESSSPAGPHPPPTRLMPESLRKLWRSFNFSLIVFTKIGYGDYLARGRLLQTLTVIEWFLGYFAIGGLIYSLTQLVPGIRDLLKPFLP